MGGVNSRAFMEMVEEEHEEEGVATPQRPHRPLQEWQDPRSPTLEIARTPIQVEKTPDSVLDPRSPTHGITRTPIYSYNASQATKSHTNQETPQTHRKTESHLVRDEQTSTDQSSLWPDQEEESGMSQPRNQTSASSKLDLENVEQIEDEAVPELVTFQDKPTDEADSTTEEQARRKQGNVVGFLADIGLVGPISPTEEAQTDPTASAASTAPRAARPASKGPKKSILQKFSPTTKKHKVKVVYHAHTNQEPAGTPEAKSGGRSPLKVLEHPSPRPPTYDGSSPRAIVQRKQASRLGMLHSPARRRFSLGSPARYSALGEGGKENQQLSRQDKENQH